MVSAIHSNMAAAQVHESTAAKQAQKSNAPSPATLKPDTVSISTQGREQAAADMDHDGDSA
jgi:hypothetical protein